MKRNNTREEKWYTGREIVHMKSKQYTRRGIVHKKSSITHEKKEYT